MHIDHGSTHARLRPWLPVLSPADAHLRLPLTTRRVVDLGRTKSMMCQHRAH